jgi:hypothetical protein
VLKNGAMTLTTMVFSIMALHTMSLNIMTLSTMVFSIMALHTMSLNIMTLSTMKLGITVRIGKCNTEINDIQC